MRLTCRPRGHHPEAAAVRRQFGHVEHLEAVRGQYLFRRIERKIGKMLMVDRVELGLLDQLHAHAEIRG